MVAFRLMFTLIFLFANDANESDREDLLGKWRIVFTDGNTTEVEFIRDGDVTTCNGMTITREPLGWVYENETAQWRVVAAEARLLVEQWPKSIAREKSPKTIGIATRLSGPPVKSNNAPEKRAVANHKKRIGGNFDFPEFVTTPLKKETPTRIKSAVEFMDAKRKEELEKLFGEFSRVKRELEDAKKAKIGPKGQFQTKKQQQATIEGYQRNLERAESEIRKAALGTSFDKDGLSESEYSQFKALLGDDWIKSRSIFADSLKIGEIGKLSGVLKVSQVVNDEEVLATVNVRGKEPTTVWLKMPTNGLVDGSDVPQKNNFVVVGTKQYQSGGGVGKTVFVLEETDLNLWIER